MRERLNAVLEQRLPAFEKKLEQAGRAVDAGTAGAAAALSATSFDLAWPSVSRRTG